MKRFGVLLLSVLLVAGCSDSTSSSVLPLVAPMVEKAAPSTTARFAQGRATRATTAQAAEAIKDFFSDNFGNISGGTYAGWVNSYLKDLDGRIEEVNSADSPDCLSATPTDVTFSVGAGGHELAAKLSCVRKFDGSGDLSGEGSGIAFGKDGNFTYVYLLLVQSNDTDKFGYVAKVNTTTEEVELLFLEAFPSYNRVKFGHLRSNPTGKAYELSIAGTGDGVGPSSTNTAHILSAGARFISNATELRADGNVSASTAANGAASPAAFAFDSAECFDSTDLSAAVATCSGSAPSFATDMTLVAGTALNGNTTIATSLQTMDALITLGIASAQ